MSGIRYEAALVIELIREPPDEVVDGQNKRPQLIWKAHVRRGDRFASLSRSNFSVRRETGRRLE